jgi:hypothetical protein
MSDTILATFDGQVFRPAQPVPLAPNTSVRLTIEPIANPPEKPASFLQTALAQRLEGPPDWATNLEEYLYGEEPERAG